MNKRTEKTMKMLLLSLGVIALLQSPLQSSQLHRTGSELKKSESGLSPSGSSGSFSFQTSFDDAEKENIKEKVRLKHSSSDLAAHKAAEEATEAQVKFKKEFFEATAANKAKLKAAAELNQRKLEKMREKSDAAITKIKADVAKLKKQFTELLKLKEEKVLALDEALRGLEAFKSKKKASATTATPEYQKEQDEELARLKELVRVAMTDKESILENIAEVNRDLQGLDADMIKVNDQQSDVDKLVDTGH